MKVAIHVRVQVPTEKMRVGKEEQKFASGTQDHGRAQKRPLERSTWEEARKEQEPGNLEEEADALCQVLQKDQGR